MDDQRDDRASGGTGRLVTPPDHISNRRPRLIGAVLIVVGLLLAKWQIYDPLRATERHKEKVWILSYFVIFAICGSAWGLLLLVFGKRVNKWFNFDPENLNLKNVLGLLAFASVGLAALFYVIHALESQGYKVNYTW